MDRQFIASTGVIDRARQNSPVTLNEGTVIFSCTAETDTIIPCPSETLGNESGTENIAIEKNNENNVREQKQSFSSSFRHSCCITKQNSGEVCETCQSQNPSLGRTSCTSVAPPSVSPSQSQESFKCSSDTATDLLQVSMEELG